MKYWIITNEYFPKKGGLVSYTRNLALEIKKQGKDIEIVTSNSKDSELKEIEYIEGIKVHRVDFSRVPIILRLFSPIIYYYRIKKYLHKLDVKSEDIVISRFYSFALAMCKSKNVKKHIFITPLIAEKLQKMEAKKSKGIRKLYYYFILPQIKFLDTQAIKHTPYIGVLSKSKRDEIEKAYKIKNVKICEPGIDIDRFNIPTKEMKETIRKNNRIEIKEKMLLCVCRLSPEKNLEILIEAMKLLENKNIYLYIVGEGRLKGKLEELIEKLNLQKYVKLLGAKNNVEDYYKMADVFILPSKYEGFGHVYIEALATGVISIATKQEIPNCITAGDEIIENDKIGELVKYDSKEDIANKIEKCFQKATENIEYRRKYILSKYTWKKHLDKIMRSFE